MSEWEIISEQRAPQTMPPPMSPPAVDNEWEVVSERKAPNAMPPPTASGGWEIIREEPASQSAWAPSLDTVNIPEYGDIDPYAYADLKPADIVGEQAPRKGDSVPVALGKAAASAIPAWGKSVGGMVRATEEASLGTPLTLSSDIAATITSPLKALKGKEYEGVDEFGQPMKMSLDWLSAVPEAYRNFAGWIRKKLPDIMNAPIIGSVEKAMGLDKSIGQTTGEYWSGIERQWQPEVEKGSLLADVTGAVASVAQVAPGIVASIITKNPNIALNTFFATTLGQTYEDIREKKPDLAPSQALAGGIISGAAEKYTEKLPLEALLNPKWGFWKRLFANMGLEVPGEEIATIVQSGIVEKATTNPDMNVKEFLQMLRDTAVQTLIASPMQVAISHPLIKYVERQEKKIAEQEQQQASQPSPAAITPENLRWLVENRETLGLSDDDVAPYLKIIENATPRPTEELSAARAKMKAGEATPQEVIDAYASKLDDIAGLMQEKEATALEARRGRYETPGQTALDFGTAGTPLFDETTQPSPATEKTQPMEGDVDETISAEAEKAKKEGYRYIQFEHPDNFGEKDFTATISLYPKEDLQIQKPVETGKAKEPPDLQEPVAPVSQGKVETPKVSTFKEFAESQGKWPIKVSDPDYPRIKAEWDKMQGKTVEAKKPPAIDSKLAELKDYKGGDFSPTKTRLYQELGTEAVEGVRLQDAEATGRLYEMMREGKATETEWEKHVDRLIAENRVSGISDEVKQEARKRLDRLDEIDADETTRKEQGITVQPDTGVYEQPDKKYIATVSGQKYLSTRGGRIAMLKGLNERAGKPYADINLENIADERIDAVRDWLVEKQKPAPKPPLQAEPAVERKVREPWEMTREELIKNAENLYHGVRGDLSARKVSGDNWIHLGTEEQAKSNHKTGNVLSVSTKIKNPAIARRDANWDNPIDALDALSHNKGPFDAAAQEYWGLKEKIERAKTIKDGRKILSEALEKKGYDSIAYPNEVEGKGVSYTTWTPEVLSDYPDLQGKVETPTEPGWEVERRYSKGGGGLDNVSARYKGGNWVFVGTEPSGSMKITNTDAITLAKGIYKEKGYDVGDKVETPVSTLDSASKEADNVLQEGKTNEPTRRYSNQELKQRIQERLNVPVKFRSLSGEAENLPAGKRSNVPAEQLRIRAGEHATLKDTAPANVPGGKVYGSQVGAFERTGRIDYSGQKVKGIRDIISLLQIARNPHVENLHFFFVGINTGTIHRNNLYSSQMPGFVAFIPEGQQAKAAWELSFRARRLAKQVGEPIDIVMAHNHPSGDPTPSPEDKKVTNSLRKRMKNLGIRMDYHVVTNHGTAAVIYGSDWDHETITIPDIANTVDPFKTEPVKNEKLGHLVMKPQHIAGVAAGFQRGDKFITVVYRSDGIVRGIENIPVGYLGAAADSKAGKPSPAADFFRGRARQFGANDIFIYKDTVSQEEFDYLTQLYDDGVIRDAVWAEGKESLYKHGYDYEQEKRYGKDFGKYRGGAVKQEGKYGEDDDTSFDFGANIEKAIEENPEKHISLDFKDHLEGYIGHLFNMVVAGEPGKRLALEGMGGQDQVVSWGSTYPEFMKGQGWSAKEVLAALRHAQAGEKTTDKQKEIIRAALHQATDMFFEDMDRWAPNLSEEALEKMEASIEPAIDDFLSKYYREKREREIERQKIARTTKITKSQYDWEREKQKAKEGAWMKGFKSRQEEVNALQSELAKTEAKLQTQIAHVRKLFEGEKIKEGAWKEAERIKNTEIKTLQGEIKRLKDRLAKAKEEAAPKPKVKRMSRKGQIRIVTGQVLANDEINLREMDALKSQIRMEAAAAREAYRAGNKAGLAKARARYQSMKDILRIKRAQQADIRKMIKQMKDVAKKADQLPPEYKLAITDLLEPWDMARLTDKNRVKLQAIRNEMETNKDADFPPSMLETLKRLDKRPIRDLSYDEIQSIHRAVMHFATLGRNKIKGMAAQQRIVREMTRGVVKGEMKEAEAGSDNYDIRYSDEKKIKGFLQKAKNQFGIHLVGWEALVESVSGPRSMFYKVIYRMVKEGSLLRDKIMYEIEDLFLKAQDAFQQKHGIKDIADWLDADRTIEYVSGKTITMSRNQLISLELGWRDADWRRSVEEGGFGLWNNPMPNDPNRVYQLGPEGIEKIIAAVTPTEREYADMAVPIIQKTGDMLADKFLEINGYEMPRTESGAYWRKDVMASERGKTDEQTELEKARLGRPGIFKGMTIQRTGDSSAVWLKPFTVAMREMSKRGADYVALEEPMSLAAWLMYDKEFRKEFDKRYGMPLWKEIEQGLKDLSDTYQPVRDTTWERVGTWLRNKSTLFALGLNYATTLKQFTGAINYLVYVDPVHLANAIVKYGTNRNDVRRLHKQMSTEYRHRREEGYSQDVGNVITSLSATGQKPSLVTRIGVAGMRPLQAIDIFGVDIGMLAAVDQALDAFKAGKLTEDMKDALDMSDEDIKGMTYAEQFEAAYKWADYCTERTQSMSRPEHMSGWQRGSEFSKQFSMFMGEVQKNLTGLYRAYNKVQRGDIGAHMHLTKNILLYLVVSSLIIDAGVNAMRDILRGRRPDRWWAVGLKAITSPIPIIRDITQTAVDTAQGKGFGLSGGDTPIARFQESIAKVVVKGTKATTGKTAKERKEAATATAGAILNTAALAAGLPWPAVQEPFRIAKREETARKERQRNR